MKLTHLAQSRQPASPRPAVLATILYLGTVAAKSPTSQHLLLWFFGIFTHQTVPTPTLGLWAGLKSSQQTAGVDNGRTSVRELLWIIFYVSNFAVTNPINQPCAGSGGGQLSWHVLFLSLSSVKWPQERERGTKGGRESFHGVWREIQSGPGSWGRMGTTAPRAPGSEWPPTDVSRAGKQPSFGKGSQKQQLPLPFHGL